MTARHHITITGHRRARLDTAAIARLLADLAAHTQTDPPEAHPTLIHPDHPRNTTRSER